MCADPPSLNMGVLLFVFLLGCMLKFPLVFLFVERDMSNVICKKKKKGKAIPVTGRGGP
jgi:hypothetical protein